MNIDPRIEPGIASVVALKRLLDTIVERPAMADEIGIQPHLRTQGALAEFSCDAGVKSSSLNAVKRACAVAFPGGFADLDKARKAAILALNGVPSSDAEHGASVRAADIKDLERQLLLAQQDLFQMTSLFRRALQLAQQIADASSSPSLVALCSKERRALLIASSFVKKAPSDG